MSKVWIKAGAGCGKTTYIINKAEEKDLYLTFNVANRVQAIAKGCKAAVWTFNSLGNQLIKELKIDWAKDYSLPKDKQGLLIGQIFVLNDYASEVSCNTLFVDEVQDLNEEMTQAIQKINYKNLVLVGDENQAIMGWNQVEYFDWSKAFPDIKIEFLDQTYRFGKSICDFSNKFRDNPLKPAPNCQSEIFDEATIEDFLKSKGTKAILVFSNKEVLDWKKWLTERKILWKSKNGGKLIDLFPEEVLKDKENYKNFNYKSQIIKQLAEESTSYVEFFNKVWDWEAKGEAIYIETVHKTKGLEFDNVFVDLPPSEKGEKRNVYYVAVTRAKKGLFLQRKEKEAND